MKKLEDLSLADLMAIQANLQVQWNNVETGDYQARNKINAKGELLKKEIDFRLSMIEDFMDL